MKSKECYHCGLLLDDKTRKTHDCWTTTEEKLTQELPEEIRDAWLRLRETALSFGEQRTYASHKSIMFAKKVCYFFVRPSQKFLEVVFFVGRTIQSPLIKTSYQTTKTKVGHVVRITHSDQAEPPLTDWLREAYEKSELLSARGQGGSSVRKPKKKAKSGKKTTKKAMKTAQKRPAKRKAKK